MLNKFKIFLKGSTTYFYSSIFFPKNVRRDVFTLYAFVRKIDDFVDQIPPDKDSFFKWKKDTNRALKGKEVNNKIIFDFITLARNKNFNVKWIHSFISAMEADLTKKDYKTFKELEQYMYGSAEVIGLMMCSIMSLPKNSYFAARTQGKAMQLINFIRDAQEDKNLRRNYIPETDRRMFGINELNNDKKWKKLAQFEINRYKKIQKAAEKGYKYIPKKYLISIKTAADMYSWTANRIYSNPEIVWTRKLKPSPLLVLKTLFKNFLTL